VIPLDYLFDQGNPFFLEKISKSYFANGDYFILKLKNLG